MERVTEPVKTIIKRAAIQERVHSLEIPLAQFSLIVPSATIAEVKNLNELAPIAGGASCVIGAFGWRMLAVPVVSFELLLGEGIRPPTHGSKIVIFYPLAGRREWEFFGILTASEPRPHAVDAAAMIAAEPDELPESEFVAAGIKIDGRLLAIPDLTALRGVLYPD